MEDLKEAISGVFRELNMILFLENSSQKWALCAVGAAVHIRRQFLENGLKYKMLVCEDHFDTKLNKIR